MPTITAVLGDITTQPVDAIVNAANNAMRGGGGVDGAIHRAGGPTILQDCIIRFPEGLATGDAGATTAGDLPARWVIHTVGPNHAAGQRDRGLLESCYRRALAVADEIGARSVAFPLISAGVYGWPRADAIAAAIDTIAATDTAVEDVRLVAFDEPTHDEIRTALARSTPLRILQGVRELHRRGYHLRVLPGMSPSGAYWRVTITPGTNLRGDALGGFEIANPDDSIFYSTGALTTFAEAEVTVATSPEAVADTILRALPDLTPTADDPDYVAWFAGLMELVERDGTLPIANADHFDKTKGWEIGWTSGVRYPQPPAGPGA